MNLSAVHIFKEPKYSYRSGEKKEFIMFAVRWCRSWLGEALEK